MDSKNRQLVIFDIDGTLLSEQSQLLLLQYLRHKKIINIMYFVKLYFWFFLYKLNIVDNPIKIFNYAVMFLSGRSKAWARAIINDFVAYEFNQHLFKDVVDLLQSHQYMGDRVILLSNAMDILVQSIANSMGVKEYIGTELELTKDGLFTGKLADGATYGSKKISRLNEFLKEDKSMIKYATFYTDHHSDISLLSMVANPIVINPTPKLRALAVKRGWQVIDPAS